MTVATAEVKLFGMFEHAVPTPTTEDATPEKQSSPPCLQSQTKLDTDVANWPYLKEKILFGFEMIQKYFKKKLWNSIMHTDNGDPIRVP